MYYAVYLLSGDLYEDLEGTIEAQNPREAAQRAFDQLDIHADEQFPQLIVVPAEEVHVFTRDESGQAVTIMEDLPRMIAKGPRYSVVRFDAAGLREIP